MAGGYTSRGALGIPIGERRSDPGTGSAATGTPPAASSQAVPSGVTPATTAGGETSGPVPAPESPLHQDGPTRGMSVPPRGSPFVFVGAEASPGLVVEQRRDRSGWQVLVAMVVSQPDGGRSLAVRWFDARLLRHADRIPPGGG